MFKYFNVFNTFTSQIEKRKVRMPPHLERFYNIFTRIVFFMVLASMGVYQYLIRQTKPVLNA